MEIYISSLVPGRNNSLDSATRGCVSTIHSWIGLPSPEAVCKGLSSNIIFVRIPTWYQYGIQATEGRSMQKQTRPLWNGPDNIKTFITGVHVVRLISSESRAIISMLFVIQPQILEREFCHCTTSRHSSHPFPWGFCVLLAGVGQLALKCALVPTLPMVGHCLYVAGE
jgi:hypothetical protein